MMYENKKECHLMVWTTNPKQRNKDNVIKFNIKNSLKVNEGDVISDQMSKYHILEILENRPSSITGYNYVTALTKWAAY